MPNVQVSDIKVSSKYLRVNSNVDDLVKSIEKVGLIHPLVINKDNELLSGGRRYKAVSNLGWEKVPVVVVNSSELEQELISIDENLIRETLDDVEFENCLKRAKEIYEELNPNAVTFEEENTPEPINIEGRDPSFSEYLSERTGLPQNTIQKAVKRDLESSSKVKKLRKAGEINTTQANHLIKLAKKDQDDILPYVMEAPKPKIKDIVKDVIEVGVDEAINNYDNAPRVAKEYLDLTKTLKKAIKLSKKILAEQLEIEGDEIDLAIKEIKDAKKALNEILRTFE